MNTFSPHALVRTDRLILRQPRLEDEQAIFVIHANPEANQHNPAGPMKSLGEAQERISQWISDWSVYGIGYWCISTLNEPQVIGVSGVRVMECSGRQVLNLYYRFVLDSWGKGYATEVAKEAVKAANSLLPALPVVARTRPTNMPSIRVAEQAGLVRRTDLDTAEHVVYAIGW